MSLADQICSTFGALKVNPTSKPAVIKAVQGDTRLHVSVRVDPKKLKPWLAAMEYVLKNKQGWDVHLCKQYFIRGGKIMYAWNFIAQWASEDISEQVLTNMLEVLKFAARNMPKVVHQITEYPLAGAGDDRNKPEGSMNPKASGYKQRGAHPIRLGRK